MTATSSKIARNLQLGSVFLLPHHATRFGGARVVVTKRIWLAPEWVEGQMAEPARVKLGFSGVDIKEIEGELILLAGFVVEVPENRG